MKYIFFLSGENIELAKWEVLRILESYGILGNFEIDGRLLLVDFEGECSFSRLGMTHEVALIRDICDFGELPDVFDKIEILPGKSCVRVKIFTKEFPTNSLEIEKKLGEILWRRGAEISVSKPQVVYRIYVTEKKCYTGVLIHSQNKKQFMQRDPTKRPFFMPSVVPPKLARTLVNLTRIREGERLLDPMCGTGSFLIEAAVMGISASGVDVYWKIADGCRRNMKFYNLDAEVLRGDVRFIPFRDESFNAIVTDYPYLRSTKSVCRLEKLYESSVSEFVRVLKEKGSAVLVTNLDIEEYLSEFKILAKFRWRVHGSLTRRIYLCEKEKG